MGLRRALGALALVLALQSHQQLAALAQQQGGDNGDVGDDGRCLDTVIFRVKNNPNLRFFSAALTDTGLDAALDGPGPYLVFAPADSAFERIREDAPEVLQLQLQQLVQVRSTTPLPLLSLYVSSPRKASLSQGKIWKRRKCC